MASKQSIFDAMPLDVTDDCCSGLFSVPPLQFAVIKNTVRGVPETVNDVTCIVTRLLTPSPVAGTHVTGLVPVPFDELQFNSSSADDQIQFDGP